MPSCDSDIQKAASKADTLVLLRARLEAPPRGVTQFSESNRGIFALFFCLKWIARWLHPPSGGYISEDLGVRIPFPAPINES